MGYGSFGEGALNRFYTPPELFDGQIVRLTKEASYHARLVLRIRVGDSVCLFDGIGHEWVAIVKDIADGDVRCELQKMCTHDTEPPALSVTLLLALIQGNRFETAIEKCTELGAARFIPIMTERVRSRTTELPTPARMKRWRRIVIGASELSDRLAVPSVSEPMPILDAISEEAERGPVLMFWEDERMLNIRSALRRVSSKGMNNMAIVIGPEGGISADEAKAAIKAGAITVSLGRRTLRAETAAIASLSISLYELGEVSSEG